MSGSNIPSPDIGAPSDGPNYGTPLPKTLKSKYWNRSASAVAVGDVMFVDPTDSDATTFDQTSSGLYSQAIDPTAGAVAGTASGHFIVVTDLLDDAGAAETAFEAAYYGPVDALADGTHGFGDELAAVSGANDLDVAATGEYKIATAIEAGTASNLSRVFLHNGNGFDMAALA